MGGRRRRDGRPIHGWLAIHKNSGITSTRVVEKVRYITQAAKAGHGGTLDPFSEGLLPIALGEATKAISLVLDGDKRYRCWVRFGSETDTGDLTGKVIAEGSDVPSFEAVCAVLPTFVGAQEQVPPIFSALHVDGQRAHEKARRGEVFVLPPRQVIIHSLTLESVLAGVAVFVVHCGKGTYMRALARDLGRRLGCPAHLERLLRTETLGFSLDDGITLDDLAVEVREGRLHEVVFPVDRVLDDIPVLRLRVEAWHKLGSGQSVWIDAEGFEAGMVRVVTPDGNLGAIGELEGSPCDSRWLCKPKRLFHLP